jgi:uncharacterized protein (DUF1684 family)
MTNLDEFRAQKNRFFKMHPQSPLMPDQQKAFQGLYYFPENPALRLAVDVERFDDEDPIVMQTSTGSVREYMRYGRFSFTVDGQMAELTIYADGDDYFLPFADSLAGTETYDAGRYLEPDPLGDDRFLVDFNLAYNPYCAYNENWSFPITPKENRLAVPIQAGEKVYPDHHA